MKNIFLVLLGLLFSGLKAQHTVGLVQYTIPNEEGYVLFSPMAGKTTYLVDKCGRIINSWTSTYKPGQIAYLLEDGSLFRSGAIGNSIFTAGGNGGIIEKYDWNGSLLWSYTVSDSFQCQHHDFKVLPNGNVLVISWDRRTRADAILNGRDSSYSNAYLWSEKVIEVQPQGTNGGNIVWEWKLWDHLVQDFDSSRLNFSAVGTHPEWVDLNYVYGPPTSSDWVHLNSIDYNATFDQVMLSSHHFSEIWIIDHSTTTAEASTHSGGNSNKGGDLLYRWGNPRTYGNGTVNDQEFFGQHNAQWIPSGYPHEGQILVFNNGLNRPVGLYSTVDRFSSPVDSIGNYAPNPGAAFLPLAVDWRYAATPSTDLYAGNISGVQPLQNGGYMICDGPDGTFIEINDADSTVWKYINPVTNTGIVSQGATANGNMVFRCELYYPDYPAFTGRTLVPGPEIELNPTTSLCPSVGISGFSESGDFRFFPNPASGKVNLSFSGSLAENRLINVSFLNLYGSRIHQQEIPLVDQTVLLNISGIPAGIYLVEVSSNGTGEFLKLVVE